MVPQVFESLGRVSGPVMVSVLGRVAVRGRTHRTGSRVTAHTETTRAARRSAHRMSRPEYESLLKFTPLKWPSRFYGVASSTPSVFRTTRPHDFQAGRTAPVHGVVPAMPVEVQRSIVEVNDVDSGNSRLDEGEVIVLHAPGAVEKVAGVAQSAGLCEDNAG